MNNLKITVPVMLAPKDFAKLARVSVKTARDIFQHYPTVRVGGRRRMKYATFEKHFLNREA
jgi:hypothetical protein